jgi:hypothetical protein
MIILQKKSFKQNIRSPLFLLEKAIQWENGLGGLGGYERIFFLFFDGFQAHAPQKNLFVSARSAQSVLP